jgi:hypothetical protein
MPRDDRAWVARLNAAEQAALAASEDFFQQPDGRLRRALSRLGRPLDAVLSLTPEGVQNKVTGVMHEVLSTVASGAEEGRYQSELVDLICARSGLELDPWERIFTVELPVLEELARSRIKNAKNMAVVQGGVTGVAGLPGLVADIPSLYFLLFRTVHQVALCFGYPVDSDAERRYLFQVVSAGHHLEWRDRRLALIELDSLEEDLARSDRTAASQDLQRTLLAKSVQQLARKLAAGLITRKAAQTVAVVGGAVGAVINRQLLEDVGQASFHAYRRRFLRGVAEARGGKL